MREDRRPARGADEQLDPADYGPDAAEEVTLPAEDVRRERRLAEAIPADEDPDVLRDGGPTRNRGVATTTGGRRAGPASVHRRPRRGAAPTTTGDATTGGSGTPAGGSTSDQSGEASQIGNFTDR
ncbi:hypothetical protein [Micromonospora zhanjiangensis]|uniref:Uncharacterized protein n=1 Tax=Micromonospora zhanjiangensis TaxID=1522057 RepID=A0ABV8KWY9_9ACTN